MTSLSPQLLEAINGFLLVEFFVIMYLFARYIAQGFYTYGWREGRRYRGSAIAVFILVLGDFIIRMCVWVWRHNVNTGQTVSEDLQAALTAGTTFGVFIAAVGGACVIRTFSPSAWGEWPWVITTIVGFAWAIYMAL